MKKIICLIVVMTLVFSSIVFYENTAYSKTKKMEMTALPSVKNIKIKITKGKNVAYYKIYRAIFTEAYVSKLDKSNARYVPKKKYKFLAKIKKRSFIDKKVKKMKLYRYAVKGFNKKGKCIESYYDREAYVRPLHIGNLEIPGLFYDDYNDEYDRTECSAKKLVLYSRNNYGGPCATSYILYRKEEGEGKFKRLFEKKIKKSDRKSYYECYITDNKVKFDHVYNYKVKFCVKTKKKKYYSKMSNPITLHAVNSKPEYKVECMTGTFTWDCKNDPEGQHEFVFKLSDTKDNGKTKIYKGAALYSTNNQNVWSDYKEYSFDNINWYLIPKEGVELPKDKPLYIKCVLENVGFERQEYDSVYFAGDTYPSYLYFYVEYDGVKRNGDFGESGMDFDFYSGIGSYYGELVKD